MFACHAHFRWYSVCKLFAVCTFEGSRHISTRPSIFRKQSRISMMYLQSSLLCIYMTGKITLLISSWNCKWLKMIITIIQYLLFAGCLAQLLDHSLRHLLMKHNQTNSHVGQGWLLVFFYCCSPRSGCASMARCAESPGGSAARIFFFLLAINLEDKSASCIPWEDRKGWEQSVCRSRCPINTVPPSPHLCPLHFANSWCKVQLRTEVMHEARDQ